MGNEPKPVFLARADGEASAISLDIKDGVAIGHIIAGRDLQFCDIKRARPAKAVSKK